MTHYLKWSKEQKLKPCTVAFRTCLNYVLGCSHCGDMRRKISLRAVFFLLFFAFFSMKITANNRVDDANQI